MIKKRPSLIISWNFNEMHILYCEREHHCTVVVNDDRHISNEAQRNRVNEERKKDETD